LLTEQPHLQQAMLSKETVSTLLGVLATASVTAVGLAVGGPIGATVMGGIGLNLSSNIIQGGYFHLKDRWVHSENGILNHDVQKALVRAIVKALSALESKYLESAQAKNLKGHERDSIKELFKELRGSAQTNLSISFAETPLTQDAWHYLVGLPDSNMDEAWDAIAGDSFLSAYGSDFRNFIRQNLLNEVLFWFNEELKTDSKETNKAWRAFQRMLLEGIYADVKAVQANQELMSQDLLKLDALKGQLYEVQDVIDRRLPNELFQQEFEAAIGDIRSTLHAINDTTQRIDRTVRVIHEELLGKQKTEPPSPEILREELSQIRRSMFIASSRWEVKETLYKVDEFLSRYPNHYEARLLRDQIEAALSYEKAMAGGIQMEYGAPSAYKASSRRSILRWIIAFGFIALVIALLYLLYRWFF
jgi:hypothetical protein